MFITKNHTIRLTLLLPVVSMAGLLASCGRSGPKAASEVEAAESKIVHVTTVPVVARQVPVFIQSSGSFVADEKSDVAPPAAGRIETTPVNIGAFVNAGQVIATLDDREAKLRLQQALAAQSQAEAALRQSQSKIGLGEDAKFDPNVVPEVQSALAAYQSALAQAKLAQADEKRYANLVATGDVSQSNFEKQKTLAETAQAQADSAKKQYEGALNTARQNYQSVGGAEASLEGIRSQLALAHKAVEDTIVRAPMAGYVSDRPVAVGEYVSASSKIATILRANPIKLHLQLSEAEAGRLRVGMAVSARVAAYGERDFDGRVKVVGPAVDTTSRSITVEAEFVNPDLTLRPGMFATARIIMPEGQQGLFVPVSSVLTDATTSSSQVFIVENGKARARVVRVGERDNGVVRVLSGVSAGSMVVTDKLKELYDGAAVLN